MSYPTKANLMMVFVSVFWGLSYVFMKMGLSSLQPFNIVALRFLLGFFIAGIFFYRRILNVSVKTIGASFMMGVLLFGVFTFVTIGVNHTSASNAGFLVSLAVVFVPLIQSVLVKEMPTWRVRISLVITLTGIALLTLKFPLNINFGDVLCIMAALCYACYIILTGKLTKQHDSVSLGVLQLGFTGVLALIGCLFFEDFSLPSSNVTWIAILGLGILCTAVGFICQTVAQKYITPVLTGLIFSLEPVSAAILAVWLLQEAFTLMDFLACFLILIGLLTAQVNKSVLFKMKTKNPSYIEASKKL